MVVITEAAAIFEIIIANRIQELKKAVGIPTAFVVERTRLEFRRYF